MSTRNAIGGTSSSFPLAMRRCFSEPMRKTLNNWLKEIVEFEEMWVTGEVKTAKFNVKNVIFKLIDINIVIYTSMAKNHHLKTEKRGVTRHRWAFLTGFF